MSDRMNKHTEKIIHDIICGFGADADDFIFWVECKDYEAEIEHVRTEITEDSNGRKWGHIRLVFNNPMTKWEALAENFSAFNECLKKAINDVCDDGTIEKIEAAYAEYEKQVELK